MPGEPVSLRPGWWEDLPNGASPLVRLREAWPGEPVLLLRGPCSEELASATDLGLGDARSPRRKQADALAGRLAPVTAHAYGPRQKDKHAYFTALGDPPLSTRKSQARL